MNTVFTNLINKQAFIAVGMSIAIFASSVVSAHAADIQRLAKMENQLTNASMIVSSLLSKLAPQGEVKGVTTGTTAQELQIQIAALRNQISILGGAQKIEVPSVKSTSASSSANGYLKPLRPECRLMSSKLTKESVSKGAELSGSKSSDCKGNELARLMASQKEVDAKIVELQAKSAQIKARIAQIKSTGSTTVPVATTGPVFKSLGNEAVVVTNSASTATDDAGRFTAKFEITANDSDVYVPQTTIDGGIAGASAVWGVGYSISQGDGKESRPGSRTATLDSTADKSGNFFVINEGETASFTLTAVFDPTVAGMYQLQLGALNWAATPSTVGLKQVQFKPAANFVTNKIQISN